MRVAQVGDDSELVLLPHIRAEVSSLSRQIGNPARARVQAFSKKRIDGSYDVRVSSAKGAERDEFVALGLTDADSASVRNGRGSFSRGREKVASRSRVG